MNKKFLSAILFGAMLATSAGTFVSCKDYDDDIKGLQTQIDTNKTAIAELQKLVGAGNWVTNVAASGENLVVTMSNGTSATIAGIKGADGVDGKNAAEWTISEDGFWCKDGEKTTNVAVAQNGKDGKDGATAPSPTISDNGMWVVYSWDAAKGEFVAEETEIPAAGTSAYVVLKNGVYTLNIADETGEFVEVALPATAESFTINGIANKDVKVVYAYGEWKTPTKKAEKELFDKLAAEFPELKEYKDKEFVAQSGKLPFIVSPANVELTKDYTFTLVDMKGKDAGATLANPTQGMPDVKLQDDVYESRAAEGTAVWSVDFVPALNKKGNGYVASTEVYSLVVSGAKGIISATPYVYTYSISPTTGALTLPETELKKLYNEEGMDIFTKVENSTEVAYALPESVLKGMFILEAVDPAQAEELGISIEGSVVTVDNMPKGKNVEDIELKLTAIAVNGAVDVATFKLDVTNVIAATGALADLDETLAGNYKNGKFVDANQEIWWSLEELELSALQMKNFAASTTTKTLKVYTTDINNNGVEVERAPINVTINKLYDANKKETTDYTKVAYIKAILNVSDAKTLPGDYTVVLTATDKDNTVILKAESELTLSNPEEDLLTIKESYLDAEGNVIAATYAVGNYQFALNNVFDLEAGTTIQKYDDLDRQYDTELTNWWTNGAGKLVIGNSNMMGKLNGEEFEATEVDKVRTIKVTYNLFGNVKNQMEKEIQVKWTSPIYAEDATDVITMTAAKLKIKFDDTTPTATNANKIDFKAITSAIWAEGSLKGQTYKLFGTAEGDAEKNEATYTDYTSYQTIAYQNGSYMKSTTEQFVDIRLEDMLALGYTADALASAQKDGAWKLKESDFRALYDAVMAGQDKNGKGLMDWYSNNVFDAYRPVATASNITNAELKKKYEMFCYYANLIKFTKTSVKTTYSDGTSAVLRASEIKSVNFKLVNADDANFLSTAVDATADAVNGFTLTAKPSKNIDKTALVEGKKVIPMEMIITDMWGKVMVYEFNVEISL